MMMYLSSPKTSPHNFARAKVTRLVYTGEEKKIEKLEVFTVDDGDIEMVSPSQKFLLEMARHFSRPDNKLSLDERERKR